MAAISPAAFKPVFPELPEPRDEKGEERVAVVYHYEKDPSKIDSMLVFLHRVRTEQFPDYYKYLAEGGTSAERFHDVLSICRIFDTTKKKMEEFCRFNFPKYFTDHRIQSIHEFPNIQHFVKTHFQSARLVLGAIRKAVSDVAILKDLILDYLPEESPLKATIKYYNQLKINNPKGIDP